MNGRFQQLVQLPRRVLSLLVHGSGRIQQVADDTQRALKIGTMTARVTSEIGKRTLKLESDVGTITRDMRTLTTELRLLRRELGDRLLQYNLQLGRLSRIATEDQHRDGEADASGNGSGTARPRLAARTVSFDVGDESPPEWESLGGPPHPDPEGREWLLLDACPMCGHGERTIVNEWNKLVLLRKAPDPSSARYDFAVCHACGVMYATRRPIGARYRFLNLNFGEVTAKHGDDAGFTNPLLNPYPLTDADRETLRRRAARGVFVSEHLGLRSNEYLEGLIKDRFENSVHLDLIGALLSPRNARVLEIRPRTGMISEGLRRLFNAEVHTMPIWESQEFLLKEVYGIESSGLVDYDQFDIPSPGPFDLVICNHMLTHAVRPQRFFDALHRRLTPGGHVYFYNEPDDAEYLSGKQSMLAMLNPLHMQAFDQKSLARALAANGFEAAFHKRRNEEHICLAKMTGGARRAGATSDGTGREHVQDGTWTPMTEKERSTRVRAYRRARDRAILRLHGDLRARFAGEWQQIVERSVADGIAEFDDEGNLRLIAR